MGFMVGAEVSGGSLREAPRSVVVVVVLLRGLLPINLGIDPFHARRLERGGGTSWTTT